MTDVQGGVDLGEQWHHDFFYNLIFTSGFVDTSVPKEMD